MTRRRSSRSWRPTAPAPKRVDGTDFTFTFSRTGDVSQALTVNYSIFPAPIDGATPGSDFPAQTGTITFAAGSATALLQFSAIDDAIVENTELFSVVVGVGVGYQVDIPNATANASIIDNDPSDLTITGTPGNDDGVSNPTLVGGAGNDTINALAGDDLLIGNGGNDILNGDAGRDRMTGGAGNDTLNGGLDFDTAVYTDATEAITVNFGAGTVTGGASIGNDTLTSTEGLKGTNFNDTFNATSFSDTSTNGGGVGYSFTAASGSRATSTSSKAMGGNDTITGNGNTRVSYQSATAGVTVNLQTGTRDRRRLGRHRHDHRRRRSRCAARRFNDTLTGQQRQRQHHGVLRRLRRRRLHRRQWRLRPRALRPREHRRRSASRSTSRPAP